MSGVVTVGVNMVGPGKFHKFHMTGQDSPQEHTTHSHERIQNVTSTEPTLRKDFTENKVGAKLF